jgi:hypothetical protein
MISQFYIYLGVVILLMTLGRIVWRPSNKAVDWALLVAFIRLDFPRHQRDLAQKIAAGLAEIVGLKIKQLRPEHTINQIADWAADPVSAVDLIKIFHAAFNITCTKNTTFRTLVGMIAAKQIKAGNDAGIET